MEATDRDGELFNPYAPPEADLWTPVREEPGAEEGIWRAGKVLVMDRGAVLPRRCVRCNRPAEVEVPLCFEHDRARKTWLGVGVIGVLSAAALLVYGLSGPNLEGFWLFGLALGLGALFVLVLANQPVRPKKIDDQHIWLTQASPDFLATLPEAPFYLRN